MMHRRIMHCLTILAIAAFVGCGGEDLTPAQQLEVDSKEYDALKTELENSREAMTYGSGQDEVGIGTRLIWADTSNGPFQLRSIDTATNTKVKYTFSVGNQDTFNYRASETVIVTATTNSGLVYKVYAVDQPEQLIAEFPMPTPGFGVRWHAYCPDGDYIYLVIEGDMTHELARINIKTGIQEHVLYLEETGMEVGAFWDFGIEGNTALMLEGGRMWSVDIAAKKATWLKHKTEAYGAQWDTTGVFYNTADGPLFYTYATGENRDIKAEINAAEYTMNYTFDEMQRYYEGGSRVGSEVAYRSVDGIFMYDLSTHKTRPLLLNALGQSVLHYTEPTLLENRTLFTFGIDFSGGSNITLYQVTY